MSATRFRKHILFASSHGFFSLVKTIGAKAMKSSIKKFLLISALRLGSIACMLTVLLNECNFDQVFKGFLNNANKRVFQNVLFILVSVYF